jgi:hypothetical protein
VSGLFLRRSVVVVLLPHPDSRVIPLANRTSPVRLRSPYGLPPTHPNLSPMKRPRVAGLNSNRVARLSDAAIQCRISTAIHTALLTTSTHPYVHVKTVPKSDTFPPLRRWLESQMFGTDRFGGWYRGEKVFQFEHFSEAATVCRQMVAWSLYAIDGSAVTTITGLKSVYQLDTHTSLLRVARHS